MNHRRRCLGIIITLTVWQGTSLLLQEVRGGERKVHVALLIISLCKNVDLLGCFEGKGSSIYKGNVDKTEKVSKAIYQNNGQCLYNVHIQIDYYKIFSNHFVLKQSLINVFFIPRSIRKKVGFLIF